MNIKLINQNPIIRAFVLMLILAPIISSYGQINMNKNYAIIKPGESTDSIISQAAIVVPTPQQYSWENTELIAFTHFGMNTFTNSEIGDGKTIPSVFNPTNFNPDQWVKVLKAAGFKMLILTAKHHDGFCLWPSKYTKYSVKYSKWKNGKGDVVKAVSDACHKYGLEFGIYLSPWDRHEKSYGTQQYNIHYLDQLQELLTNYGKISEVWFDGYRGPGAKKQVYAWSKFYALIRKLQPDAVISGQAPDVRWVGTESGYGRDTEWSVVPINVSSVEKLENSKAKFPVDQVFIPKDMMGKDLGGIDKLKTASVIKWYPSEADVSIRPGWFYHSDQDSKVKTGKELADIYFNSVGKNSELLLNVPPDKEGLINSIDADHLMDMRRILDGTFNTNLAEGAKVYATNEKKGFDASFVIDNNNNDYWTTDKGVDTASITFGLLSTKTFDAAMLEENIRAGQRIAKFELETWDANAWKTFTEGTTIGHKRLLRFPEVSTAKVRLVIEKSRTSPTLLSFGLYEMPSEIR
jgi:alpha-L-fucosidase